MHSFTKGLGLNIKSPKPTTSSERNPETAPLPYSMAKEDPFAT